jgi:hypothetical protein
MDPSSGARSFKGTIFHVWKGNRPCRIYVADGRVYFIRRVVEIDPGTAGVLGSHIADIIDARIEPKGQYVSYGKNAGRWHFTRRGDAKETVVLLESPDDASQAVVMLSGVLGQSMPRTDRERSPDLVTDHPRPSEDADVVNALQSLTQLLGERAPAGWQKVRCEVRVAPPGHPTPLEIVISDGDRPDEHRAVVEPAIYQAAMRLARKLSPSVRTFPGVVIEMTRLDQSRWHHDMKVMNTQ